MSATYRGGEPVAEIVRSGFAESLHRGSVAVTDSSGNLLASIGDTGSPVFPRSSNKPMQALAMLRAGWAPGTEADLAIASASHRGEPFHLAQVASVLGGAGLGEADLQCPPDLPSDPTARNAVVAAGAEPRRVYMNCSGKHAGMLAACAANGWDLATYRDPEHPFQQLVIATVEELTGDAVESIGVDGCGAPVLAVTLAGLARAFARLVEAPAGSNERRVADAMRANAKLIDGTRGPDHRMMTALPGLLAKGGAEGVHVLAAPGVGAVAVKIDDGAGRASTPVALRALTKLAGYEVPTDAKPEVDSLTWPEVTGGEQQVGRLRPLL